MVIGVCDDDERDRVRIASCCREILKGQRDVCEVFEFASGEQYLLYGGRVDILILDIKMPGMSGIELKEHLRESGSKTEIVFVTDHEEAMKSAFGLQVLDFVGKDEIPERLRWTLLRELQRRGRYVVLKEGIDSRDIRYAESAGNYCRVHLEGEYTELLTYKMKDLEQELPVSEFARIHRRFLVNLAFVGKIRKGKVFMKDGGCLPISTSRQKAARERYDQYRLDKERRCR